jgi:1,4-dihydroxy-2-naphthoate octaprenyltransferase
LTRSASITDLLRVARPQFSIAGLALFVFGASWAILLGAPFSLPRVLLGYLVLLTAQLSASYSNDYFDVEVDKHDSPNFFSGGSGVLVDHPGLRQPAKWTAIALIACSLVLGIVFQIVYSFSILFSVFVILGNLISWFYSAPPVKLAYRGFGELAMMVLIGVLIPGMGFLVTSGQMGVDGLLFSIPMMLYGLAFNLAIEIPDMESDRLGGKRSWVARKGRSHGFAMIAVSFLLAALFFFGFPLLSSRIYPLDFEFFGIISLIPLGAGLVAFLKRPVEKQLANRIVGGIMVAFMVFFILVVGYMVVLAFG